MSNDLSAKSDLDTAITKVFVHLSEMTVGSDEYATTADQLTQLYKLREIDHKIDTSKRVSKETLALVGANLAGILLILGHERFNVIATKGLGLLMKLR